MINNVHDCESICVKLWW